MFASDRVVFRQTIQNIPAHIGLIECRFDGIRDIDKSDIDEAGRVLAMAPQSIRSIATIRRSCDGGRWIGSESVRQSLLSYCIQSSYFDFVDVEEDVYCEGMQHVPNTRDSRIEASKEDRASHEAAIICSFHDCTKTPTDIQERVDRMCSYGTIIKLAVMLNASKDQLQLIEIARHLQKHKKNDYILIGMGIFGRWSRILYKKLGSMFTYAHNSIDPPAPGMMTYSELIELYRVDQHSEGTKIFGIIGNPLEHSHSPAFHNAIFSENTANAVYVPFPTDDCQTFFTFAKTLAIEGFSVTVPHKRSVMKYLQVIESQATACSAVNTVIMESSGYVGHNTDYFGFLEPLREAFSERLITGKLRAAMIGAGGAASAVLAGLVDLGCQVIIYNRTLSKAELLARKYDDEVCAEQLRSTIDAGHDIIVQCTDIGMYPNREESPIPDYDFSGKEIVYDLIYNPAPTAFLARAQAAGCLCITGEPMFRLQAKCQSEMFLNRLK